MDTIKQRIEQYAEWAQSVHEGVMACVDQLASIHKDLYDSGLEEAQMNKVSETWSKVQQDLIEAEEPIRQWVFAQVSGYERYGPDYPNPLPEGCEVAYNESLRVYRLKLPLWLFGWGPENKVYRHPYANLRSGCMLVQTFWYRFVEKWVTEQLPQNHPRARDIDPTCGRARITIDFWGPRHQVRDVDHYSPSHLVNALVSEGLLVADGPENLEYLIRGHVLDSTEEIPKWYRRGFVEFEIQYNVSEF